jgi:CRISPR-associated protein Cas6
VPHDFSQSLNVALQQKLPWLAQERQAGIHPLKLVHGAAAAPEALLSARTRLLLRLPRGRVEAAAALAGCQLALAGHAVELGAPHVRELLPHATLYAYSVAAQGEDEVAFIQAMEAELKAMGIRGRIVCGKRGSRSLDGRTLTTFSLMLHALSPTDSLHVQELGLGDYRLLGCGIFVPHKSAAAVGD